MAVASTEDTNTFHVYLQTRWRGRNVKVLFTTGVNRTTLSGFWFWDETLGKHVRRTRKQLCEEYPTKNEWEVFLNQISHHHTTWKRVARIVAEKLNKESSEPI